MTTVAFEFHWSPKVMNNMYFDRVDADGLIFWCDKIKEAHQRAKESQKR